MNDDEIWSLVLTLPESTSVSRNEVTGELKIDITLTDMKSLHMSIGQQIEKLVAMNKREAGWKKL